MSWSPLDGLKDVFNFRKRKVTEIDIYPNEGAINLVCKDTVITILVAPGVKINVHGE